MSILYKIFNDSGLTALTNYIKTTRAKAVSNEAAIGGLGEDLAGLSGEVVTALDNKQNKLTFDTTPTAGSTNPVTSGGIKTALDGKYTKPSTGIPKSDLASAVQTSLGKADTAIQSLNGYATETYVNSAIDSIDIPDPGLQVVTTAGTGSAYTATVSGIDSFTTGASFIMIPNVVSTSVSPTLNVNNLGAKTIRRPISTNTTTTVAASDASWLAAGKPIMVTYNGTYWVADLTRPYATDLYGTVPVTNGGTGATDAATARENLGAAAKDHTQAASTVSSGTFAGQVVANANAVQTLTTKQVRNIYAGTEDMTAGTTELATGDIYIVYE